MLHQLRVRALQERLQLVLELHGPVDHAIGLAGERAQASARTLVDVRRVVLY